MLNNPKAYTDYSFITELVCSDCGAKYSASTVNTFCLDCQAPLLANYDLDGIRTHFKREDFSLQARARGMWRWHELLPVQSPFHCVTLGEGDGPLLKLSNLGGELGLSNLYVKDESGNPTGSFKARGLAVAISKARELGIRKVIIPTAGNAGGAMAAYAARAGMKAVIYMPQDAPHANVVESRLTGAEVVLIDGIISDAAGMVGVKARAEGWFDLSTFKEPYRVEGKKIMGYEIAEAFGWELPDVIIYPTGGGTGLIGMWKAFAELEALGWLKSSQKPRMVVVQAEGCAPIVKAFQAGAAFSDFWINAHTLASGLRVPKSFADALILKALRESGGQAVTASDVEILAAQSEIGHKEGLFPAPEGAATLVAARKLVDQKWIQPDERVVLFNTGSGLKYLEEVNQ